MPMPPLRERNTEIWRAYCAGATQSAIAAEYGLTQPRVSSIIIAARSAIPPADRVVLVERDMALLDQLRVEALGIWDNPPPVTYQGSPVLNADGTAVPDINARLAAHRAIIMTMERQSKLLGLDAPSKVAAEVTSPQFDPALREKIILARQAAAKREAAIQGEES